MLKRFITEEIKGFYVRLRNISKFLQDTFLAESVTVLRFKIFFLSSSEIEQKLLYTVFSRDKPLSSDSSLG